MPEASPAAIKRGWRTPAVLPAALLGEVALSELVLAEVALAEVAIGIAASQKAVTAAINATARERV